MTQTSAGSLPWFDEYPVLGSLPPHDAAQKLRELGDNATADVLDGAEPKGILDWSPWPIQDRPWQHTAHAFGYLAPGAPGDQPAPLRHAGSIQPDTSLRQGRITIKLDRLRVAAYPGGGMHRVLFDFAAQNRLQNETEDLHFNATFRVRDGEHAAVLGYPIFVGLNVGNSGVALKCFTVNVQNEGDEALLSLLEGDVFRNGLKLAATVQPAIAPLSGMAVALTRTLAARNRNVPVQDFQLGLDFSSIPTGARLAEGAYFAVQIPESLQVGWDWHDWMFLPSSGQVVNRADPTQLIPYNYLVFSVTRHEEH
jgi:hypothetical protein